MTEISKPDRVGLLTIQFIALILAAVALGAGAITAVTALTSEGFDMVLPAAASLPGGVIGDPEATGTPRILNGEFTAATTTMAGLSTGVRILFAAGAGVGSLAFVALALSVAYLCWRLYKGKPFGPSVTRTFWFAAGALTIGSLLSQGMLGFSTWLALDELHLDPVQFPLEMHFDLLPVIAGFALLLVASAFQFGERMQRDTRGLI